MGILGGLYNLLNPDTSAIDNARKNNERNRQLYENVALPTYQDYVPENYNYETIKEDPTIRSAQMAALAKMSGLADSGLSTEDEAAFTKARQQAGQIQKAGNDAAIANANARGVGGSGLEFAMREMANQQGAQNAQNAGMDQATASARQRLLYNQAYQTGLGNQRAQDFTANQANTGIVNRFNEANTNNHNQAFQYNQGLKDRTYNNQMRRADALAGINNNDSQIQYERNAYDHGRLNGGLDMAERAGVAYMTNGASEGIKKKPAQGASAGGYWDDFSNIG